MYGDSDSTVSNVWWSDQIQVIIIPNTSHVYSFLWWEHSTYSLLFWSVWLFSEELLHCVVEHWIISPILLYLYTHLIFPSLLPTRFLGPTKSPSTFSFYELGILAFTFRGTQQLFGVKDISRNLTQRNTFLCGKSECVLGSSRHWDVSMTIMSLPVEPQISIHSISHCHGDSDWFSQ